MVAPSSGTAHLELEPDLSAPARARRAVTQLADGDPALAHRLALLVTELVTNSVRHAGLAPDDRVEVRAFRENGHVRVEVHDPGRNGRAPRKRPTDPLEGGGGLGLRLLEQLADDWGAGRVPEDGTRAWFVLRS